MINDNQTLSTYIQGFRQTYKSAQKEEEEERPRGIQ